MVHLSKLGAELSSINMIEVEQKYRISDPALIRRKLSQLGAKRLRSGREHNELFDANGHLKKQKHFLRLRRFGEKEAYLTLKGPRLKGRYKRRLEIETPVDYERTKLILKFLNFKVIEYYGKKREEYKLKSCLICLDYIEDCGWFLEIEGFSRNISKVSKLFGLRSEDKEHRSYRKLIKEKSSQLKQELSSVLS